MHTKLMTWNLQNLFRRPAVMDGDTLAEGAQALCWYAAINELLGKPAYSAEDKVKILDLLDKLGVKDKDDGGSFAILRQNKGRLLTRHKTGEVEVVAEGRDSWIGWVELKVKEVDEIATENTARVIKEVDPDVMAVVEAEGRPALVSFSEHLLPQVGGIPFKHVMSVETNDARGIDPGLMCRAGYDIESIRSHVDDTDDKGLVFCRDCAVYRVHTPSGHWLWVLVNHFKSQGYGTPKDNDAKRLREATRVREIYQQLIDHDAQYVAVVGDFNATPESKSLDPLLKHTDLRDIFEHPAFVKDGRPGTYANGSKSQKIDYLLLSPKLYSAVIAGGVFRKGVWGGAHGDFWDHFDTMQKPSDAASDHAAVWAEVNL